MCSSMSNYFYILAFLLICGCAGEDYDDDEVETGQFLEKYVAGSTDDLGRLFDLEKQLFESLNKFMLNRDKCSKDDLDKIQAFYLKYSIDESLLRVQDTLSYVEHPINSFHLMKRTTVLWQKLFDDLSDDVYLDAAEDYVERFPLREDFEYGAAFALLSVQLYYNQNFTDMANGVLVFPKTGERFKALHKLTSEDFLSVSDIARYVLRYDKMVEWAEAAFQLAKTVEGANTLELRKLNKQVEGLKTFHDDILIKKGLASSYKIGEGAYDGIPEAPLFTASRPYNEELSEIPSYQKSRRKMKQEMEITKPFVDIRPLDEKDPNIFMERSFRRMWQTMQPTTRQLCNGDSSIRHPKYDQQLKCVYLHYNHPYLILGPFKYEPLNSDPHVGIFRDFYSDKELDTLKEETHGKLHSTEYRVAEGLKYYTSQRVSKRHNMDEDDHPIILTSSKRTSMASRYILHQKTYSAESYKIINYGMGGHIEVHVDYWGPGRFLHPGGARTVTFMGYMTDVTAGGYTVFPALGLFVEPKKGDALFWLTVKNDLEYDSRMFHLGCPVLVGNKWVLTKWLYADDQMWNHPCQGQEGDNYPIFSNQQRHSKGFKV